MFFTQFWLQIVTFTAKIIIFIPNLADYGKRDFNYW